MRHRSKIRHGTNNAYTNRGCRCGKCRKARSAYARGRYARLHRKGRKAA